MSDLSILIPARNEPYLQKTIDDIFKHSVGDTEVLVALDGYYAELKKHPRLGVVHFKESIGQRAATNALASFSKAKYVMKIDAHCSFSQGFDARMMLRMDNKTIMAPYLLTLDADNWEPRHYPMSSAYCFDTNLVMQYNTKAENKELVNETMCLQGSAWMVERENYWKWKLGDESLGSWGHQGVELGIKAYLNNGRCVTNKDCFYAHLFREKEEDFPYERDKGAIKATSDEFKKRFLNARIAGLIEKYNYPCDWTPEFMHSLTISG